MRPSSRPTHRPAHCVIVQRPMARAELVAGRDVDWAEAMAGADPVGCVPVAATDPLYILYTSGTTGRPKGVVRDNGGHAVALRWSLPNVYGAGPGDVFWAASDVGWVVGHSYIVYAPLLTGCTTILYEGKPVGTPDPGAFWRVVADHGVNVAVHRADRVPGHQEGGPQGRAPGPLRPLVAAPPVPGRRANRPRHLPLGPRPARHPGHRPLVADRDRLAHRRQLRRDRAAAGQAGIADQGGAGVRRPRARRGRRAGGPPMQEGAIVIRLPLPPGCFPTLYQDDERFVSSYLARFDGYYLTGDGGHLDEDGYLFVMGRTDDVINVAGHRLSTGAMEEVIATHPDVAECAVIGVADELKGQVPLGLVVLKAGAERDAGELEAELVRLVRDQIGPVAAFKSATVVPRLPKTRSGKILRATMRAIADGRDYRVPSTIDDPAILDEIGEAIGPRPSPPA